MHVSHPDAVSGSRVDLKPEGKVFILCLKSVYSAIEPLCSTTMSLTFLDRISLRVPTILCLCEYHKKNKKDTPNMHVELCFY